MTKGLILGIVGTSLALDFIFAIGYKANAYPAHLCNEVREEVTLAVEAGLISQDRADSLNQRCLDGVSNDLEQ